MNKIVNNNMNERECSWALYSQSRGIDNLQSMNYYYQIPYSTPLEKNLIIFVDTFENSVGRSDALPTTKYDQILSSTVKYGKVFDSNSSKAILNFSMFAVHSHAKTINIIKIHHL